jgi:N,N'-diacetyllegionaminate synthase
VKIKMIKRKVCVVTGTRPANGINPMRWDEIIGTVATKDYVEDELI